MCHTKVRITAADIQKDRTTYRCTSLEGLGLNRHISRQTGICTYSMCTSRKRQDYSRLSIKKQDYICIRTSRRGEGYSCISPKGQNYIYISPEGQDYSCISIGKDGLQQHYRQNQSCQSPEGQNNNCTEVGLQLHIQNYRITAPEKLAYSCISTQR